MKTLTRRNIKQEKSLSNEDKTIIFALEDLKSNIAILHNQFNYITDPLLIDSCIYQISSLQNKYTYYLKLCKERGVYMS